mmetsp:Transcript_53407/g.134905  ORF Transcript_53407/g.134905 Transcript_53407/m.134905 type:complete len:246 (+) Transcript_53407:593-1330(+)
MCPSLGGRGSPKRRRCPPLFRMQGTPWPFGADLATTQPRSWKTFGFPTARKRSDVLSIAAGIRPRSMPRAQSSKLVAWMQRVSWTCSGCRVHKVCRTLNQRHVGLARLGGRTRSSSSCRGTARTRARRSGRWQRSTRPRMLSSRGAGLAELGTRTRSRSSSSGTARRMGQPSGRQRRSTDTLPGWLTTAGPTRWRSSRTTTARPQGSPCGRTPRWPTSGPCSASSTTTSSGARRFASRICGGGRR